MFNSMKMKGKKIPFASTLFIAGHDFRIVSAHSMKK